MRGKAMSIQVSTHLDEATKAQFDKVCERMGITPSNALYLLIKGAIIFNGTYFNAAVPAKTSQKQKMSRQQMFGCMRGKFEMSANFDEPLSDFMEYME